MNVGGEILQPGDWLALHYGLVEARDPCGTCSGRHDWLTYYIGRQRPAYAARGTAPPVSHAVLDHPGREPVGRRHSRAGPLERAQAGLTAAVTRGHGYLEPHDRPHGTVP
jgi:hypothetical protein